MLRMTRDRFGGAVRRVTALSLLLTLLLTSGQGTALAAQPRANPAPVDDATPPLFLDFTEHFVIDLIATVLIVYVLYYRRHGRRDLLMPYLAFNVGLFLVLTMLSLHQTGLGIGFGLFGVLSIIRLRSEPFSNLELGYFFLVLALAIVNALQVGGTVLNPGNQLFVGLLNLVAVLVVYVADHPRLQQGVGHRQVMLDVVHEDEAELRADLARRLHATIVDVSILRVDYVRDTMLVDVRYVARPGTGGGPAPVTYLDGTASRRGRDAG